MTRARTLADLGSQSLATDAELASEVSTLNSTIGGLTTGKVLQVVRGPIDGTARNTTSTSLVDANISVTITPTQSTSQILLLWSLNGQAYVANGTNAIAFFTITDSANNIITGEPRIVVYGATASFVQTDQLLTVVAYDNPATTSAITYKGRFRLGTGSLASIRNIHATGQMYAIEVAA